VYLGCGYLVHFVHVLGVVKGMNLLAILNTGGIVISVVVGGEVGLLRSIEEGCGVVIDEMPIHVSVAMLVFVHFDTIFRVLLKLPLRSCPVQ